MPTSGPRFLSAVALLLLAGAARSLAAAPPPTGGARPRLQPPPTPRRLRPPPRAPRPPSSLLLPQYYINFGRCGHDLQQQEYGTWVMTRPLSLQTGGHRLVFELDTRNTSAVAPAFGTVEPAEFPIRQLNLAYFNISGVMAWSPALDKTPYNEVRSYYALRVNSNKPITTVRDLKDVGTKPSFTYSLKARLNGAVAPSPTRHRIEVIKACALGPGGTSVAAAAAAPACAAVPDPASVFLSPEGNFAYSFWGVGQPMTVNGVYYSDHAWCPVQTGVTVP